MTHRPPWRLLALSFALSCATAPAHANEPEPAAGAHAAEPTDPMDRLRLRLQEKLGASKAPDAVGTNELRVAARQPPAPSRPTPELAALVAAHRQGKAPPAAGHDAHWSYGGETGPSRWGELKPEYALCASGGRQSPIDIRDGIAVELAPVQFDYRPGGFAVIDNGHTVQVDVAPGSAIEVMGRRYELQQFHFHRPSEERINGRQYEMSVHLVHKDPDGRLAVVAVLLERGAAQPVVQQVWNNLPLEKNEAVRAPHEIDPGALLPADRRYYTYMGSLTTPPCSEGVLWMVMQQPVPASPPQIGIFQRLYPMNARPVQAAAGRLIKQSN
jgi:carbonic anhydrase